LFFCALLACRLTALSRTNRDRLRLLVSHLAAVAARKAQNLMSAYALSVCLGPCVFPNAPSEDIVEVTAFYGHANKALELMIVHCDAIFAAPPPSSAPGLSQ